MVQVKVNGFAREYPEGTTWLEVAEDISTNTRMTSFWSV